MKTTLTPLDPADFIGPAPAAEPDLTNEPEVTNENVIGPRVKLTVEIDAETFDADVDAAFRKLAREVRIPGFRPGRAPRRVLESHFGADIGRAQALEEALPRYFAEAVRDNQVDVVNQPELELTLDGSDGPVAFEATVEVRPEVSISGYDSLRIEIPDPVPSEENIDNRIDDLRHQFSDIVEVERAAGKGDRVTIDIEGTVDGTPLPGLSAQDYLYELGSGGIVPEVDEQLLGCEAGAEVSFSAPHPVQPERVIEFEITVHTVSELVLPELTDDWVDESTEHDSIAELREATARQLSFGRIMHANMVLRDEAQKQVAGLVAGPVPDAMVSGLMAERLNQLVSGLQQRDMSFEEWLETNDREPTAFIGELRDEAEHEARADLALRALAAAEGLVAEDDEIEAALDRMSDEAGRSTEEMRRTLTEADGLAHLTSIIRKNKALQWAIETATLVDPDGNIIDRASLEPPLSDDADDERSDDERSDDGPSDDEHSEDTS